MGFFSSLGSKISHGLHSIGKKASSVVKRGTKWVGEHAASIETGADMVGKIAGGLATGAAMIGLEPVAAGLGVVAAGAKGVSKLAGMADTAYQAGQAIDHLRSGSVGKGILSAGGAAIKAGQHITKDQVKDVAKQGYKQIQRARNKQVAY